MNTANITGVIIALSLVGGAIFVIKQNNIPQEAAITTTKASKETQAKILTAAELSSVLTNKDFTLVNVHTPYEGEIAGTDVFTPYDTIEASFDKLPQDKNAKIVLYCKSGRMSTIAAETLIARGYTNVYNLEGGMDTWEQNNYQIIKN